MAWGLSLAAAGTKGLRFLAVPLIYLAFMVPWPNFLETRLTSQLQLISSELGVAVIRMAGYSVFLEGNVIDLGELTSCRWPRPAAACATCFHS